MRFWSVRDSERYPWEFFNIQSLREQYLSDSGVPAGQDNRESPSADDRFRTPPSRGILKVFPSGWGRTFERAT